MISCQLATGSSAQNDWPQKCVGQNHVGSLQTVNVNRKMRDLMTSEINTRNPTMGQMIFYCHQDNAIEYYQNLTTQAKGYIKVRPDLYMVWHINNSVPINISDQFHNFKHWGLIQKDDREDDI